MMTAGGLNLLARLMLLFILIPLAELAILTLMAQYTGLLTTIAIVLGTGALGAALARHQGFRVWREVQQQLSVGKMPSNQLADAAMIVLAGAFLITPGLITDTLGFCLLVPKVRRWVASRIMARATSAFRQGAQQGAWKFEIHSGGFSGFSSSEHISSNSRDQSTGTREASVKVIDPIRGHLRSVNSDECSP